MIVQDIVVGGARLQAARWRPSGGDVGRLPLLLIHEGLGSIQLWKSFPEQLAKAIGREVIAWSRQGYGWSDRTNTEFAIGYMHDEADLIAAVHASLGLEQAHWLGHSDGASIALLGAARYPGLAASLVLEAPHIFVEPLTLHGIAAVAERAPTTNLTERLGRYHADAGTAFTRWRDIWLDPGFAQWNIEAELRGLACPTLMIQGEDDEFGTVEQLDRIARLVPDACPVMLGDCRHSPHFDQTDATLGAIANFLAARP